MLLAGCSSSSEKSSESLPDAATLLKESNTATRALKSVHLELAVEGEIKDLPIKTLGGDLTQSPAVAAQGKSTLLFQGSTVDANFVVIDGGLYVALSGDSYIDMGPAADVYDIAAILSPDTGLANVLASFTNWRWLVFGLALVLVPVEVDQRHRHRRRDVEAALEQVRRAADVEQLLEVALIGGYEASAHGFGYRRFPGREEQL